MQRMSIEEQIRQEQEIIDRTKAVLERLKEEKAWIEETMKPYEIEYQIQMATVRLGINAAEKHIHVHEMSLQTIMDIANRRKDGATHDHDDTAQ